MRSKGTPKRIMPVTTACVIAPVPMKPARMVPRLFSVELQPGRLQLAILIVRVDRLVASAEAGLPEAAERRRQIALAEAVHGHGARADARRDLVRLVHIVGPQRCREAVARI